MDAHQLVTALKAAAEPTRLRVLLLLSRAELNVKDLTRILGQSQPRISRHLKLLHEAGLIERSREGSWVYFTLGSGTPTASLARSLVAQVDTHDPIDHARILQSLRPTPVTSRPCGPAQYLPLRANR